LNASLDSLLYINKNGRKDNTKCGGEKMRSIFKRVRRRKSINPSPLIIWNTAKISGLMCSTKLCIPVFSTAFYINIFLLDEIKVRVKMRVEIYVLLQESVNLRYFQGLQSNLSMLNPCIIINHTSVPAGALNS
jgi:hypothetical protein